MAGSPKGRGTQVQPRKKWQRTKKSAHKEMDDFGAHNLLYNKNSPLMTPRERPATIQMFERAKVV